MALTTRDRIDRWLGDVVAVQPQGDGVVIVLVHAAVDQTQRTVKTWRLNDAVENLERLVDDIEEVAEGDAEGLGGRQRYVLRGQAKGKDIGSLTLRFEFRGEDGAAVDSEPATAAGTIAVLQRHAEGAMRMMVQSFAGVIESYKEQVNAQKSLIADFQKQAADNFRLQEELASRRIEQDLLQKQQDAQLQITAAREAHEIQKSQLLWGEGLKQLFQWGPVILGYLTKEGAGKSAVDVMEDKQREAEEKLFANATEADVEGWRAQLSPEHFAAIYERYRAYRAERGGAKTTATISPTVPDEQIARTAVQLHRELQSRADGLGPLATALSETRSYGSLKPDERSLVDEIAEGLENVPGEALWSAFATMSTQALFPLASVLRAGTPWSEIDRDSKLKIMTIAARALRTVAPADRDEQTASA